MIRNQMKTEIKKLIKAIGDDYALWASKAFEANRAAPGYEHAKINEFRNSIWVLEGSKYLKITTGNTVWGFVNKGNKDFKIGDILKAANWRAPALNRSRGNIFEDYSIAWTGPHYISGYSAGGTRDVDLLKPGRAK